MAPWSGIDFSKIKRFGQSIIGNEDVDYSQFESRMDNTDIVTFRENDKQFRLFGTNVHVKIGAYIACAIGFAITILYCISYSLYHTRGMGRNQFIDQLELADLVFAFIVGLPCHVILFLGIFKERKQFFTPFLIFYCTNFLLNCVFTVLTFIAAAFDLHRQLFGNVRFDLSWSAFQILFTSAQGLAIYVVLRCRTYVAAKCHWRERAEERKPSAISDSVEIA